MYLCFCTDGENWNRVVETLSSGTGLMLHVGSAADEGLSVTG